jgi:hypothetical protein
MGFSDKILKNLRLGGTVLDAEVVFEDVKVAADLIAGCNILSISNALVNGV